jgi:hypothetical protein
MDADHLTHRVVRRRAAILPDLVSNLSPRGTVNGNGDLVGMNPAPGAHVFNPIWLASVG